MANQKLTDLDCLDVVSTMVNCLMYAVETANRIQPMPRERMLVEYMSEWVRRQYSMQLAENSSTEEK